MSSSLLKSFLPRALGAPAAPSADAAASIPTESHTADLSWTAVDESLWVANQNGEYAGIIESSDSTTFIAHNNVNRRLGRFNSLSAAKDALRGSAGPGGSTGPRSGARRSRRRSA